MNKEIKTEKRQHIRINFENQILIYQITKSQTGNIFVIDRRKILGKSKDISVGGMRAELQNASSISQFLKLNFELEKNTPLEIYAERVWENAGFYGLRFTQRDEDFSKLISAYVDHS
jgi:predicted NUDIX family phosphoesterase